MKKTRVLQQSLDTKITGGTSTEFLSLDRSSLSDKYEFIPAVLDDYRTGISLHDIRFYYRKVRDHAPEIIHIRGAGPDGLNAVIGAKLAGKVKILVTVHGMYSDLVYAGRLKRFLSKHFIERLTLLMADGISCVCKAAEDRPYFDRYRSKMLPFVYNRMPVFDNSQKARISKETRAELGIAEDAVIGLYVGRVTREKGLDILTKALMDFADKLPGDFVAVIVGDGGYLSQMKKDAEGLPVKMIFTGERKDVERFYHAADFFILPSLHENHSIALLEACAAQLPSIATDCGGNPEIITDGVTGLLIPTADANALGEAMVRMCDADLRRAMRENICTADYSAFSDKEAYKSLDTVYRLLLDKT